MSEPDTQSSEIVQRVDDEVLSPDLITQPSTGALQRLGAEVAALDKAFHWAKAMSKTTMVPQHFQQSYIPKGANTPLGETAAYNLAAAVMYGIEIGLSAMQSAQNVFVVRGKPAVYARTMAAQVRAAGHVIEEVEASDQKVVWKALRDGVWVFSEWTMERAAQAQYTSNELYQKNPQEMLRAKAIAEVCRIKFQDILLGMAYSIEELQLQDITVQRPVRQGARGTAQLREIAEQQAGVIPEPEMPRLVGEGKDDTHDDQGNQLTPPEPAEGVRPSSNAQLTEIRKLYKARNVTGSAILDDISQFLQRKVERLDVGSLSHEDAVAILEMLAPKADS